jgi:hypothetical protein
VAATLELVTGEAALIRAVWGDQPSLLSSIATKIVPQCPAGGVLLRDTCIRCSDGSSVQNPTLSERARSPLHGIYVEGTVTNRWRPYWGWRLSERTIARYLSRSLLRKASAWSTLIGSARRQAFALIRTRFSSLMVHTFMASFSRATTSSGVPGGANNADQMLYSKFLVLALSPIVGTSGKAGLRASLATGSP